MRLLSVTPIARRFPHALTELTRGIRVIERPIFAESDWRFWNLRRTEAEAIQQRSHWLCAERESSWPDHATLAQMADDLRTAMLGFQLWAPVGWDGLILDCWQLPNQQLLKVETVHLPEPYWAPLWARMLNIEKFDPAQLRSLVEGAIAAVDSGSVPLVNPFRFLEIGFQTAVNHRRAGAVLWMMGLDGLLAAENEGIFSRRLQKLLGADERVFPEDWIGRRPTYTVRELASGMYEFRSLIAHGREILQKYRDPIKFEYEPNEAVQLTMENWSRGTLMIESTVFCLIAALRKVITGNLAQRVMDHRIWKRWLDAPL